MPVFRLSRKLTFPPAHMAIEEGLLAVGGDLSVERLLQEEAELMQGLDGLLDLGTLNLEQ